MDDAPPHRTKRPRVAKRFVPTEDQRASVRSFAMLSLPQKTIAKMVYGGPISVDTLQRHFKLELLAGKQNPEPLTEHQVLLRKATGKPSRRQRAAMFRYLQMYGGEHWGKIPQVNEIKSRQEKSIKKRGKDG